MTQRQPSIAETKSMMKEVEAFMQSAKYGYKIEGVRVYKLNKKGTYGEPIKRHGIWVFPRVKFQELPFSDITERCNDCNNIIIDRRDTMPLVHKEINPDFYKQGNSHLAVSVKVCLSCYNKRRPLTKAAEDVVLINREIRRAKEQIRRMLNDNQNDG